MPATDNILALEKEGVSARIYLESLTGLRGIAAAWVALWHAWGFAGRPEYRIELGHLSFELTPLIRTGWGRGGHLLRAVRIRPWSRLLPGLAWEPPSHQDRRVFPAAPAAGSPRALGADRGAGTAARGSRQPVAAPFRNPFQALLTHNLLGSQKHQLNPVYWTLPVEFDFYLLLPLMALLVSPRRWPWLLLLGLAAVVGYRYALFHSLLAQAPTQEKVWWLNQLPGRIDQVPFRHDRSMDLFGHPPERFSNIPGLPAQGSASCTGHPGFRFHGLVHPPDAAHRGNQRGGAHLLGRALVPVLLAQSQWNLHRVDRAGGPRWAPV